VIVSAVYNSQDPDSGMHSFFYRVTVVNEGTSIVQLLGRSWYVIIQRSWIYLAAIVQIDCAAISQRLRTNFAAIAHWLRSNCAAGDI
jgi:hypothetical protein